MRGWKDFGISRLRHAQVFLGFLISRIAAQRFIELDHSLGDLALGQIHSAQTIICNSQFRVPPKYRQVMSFRLIETSIRKKSIRETKLSIRIVRLESENCPELADVFVIFALGDKESCIAVMRVGRVW